LATHTCRPGCTLPSPARALAKELARFATRGGRIQQRHGSAAHRTEEKCKENASGSGAFVSSHYQILTFTLRNFLGSFRISAMSARISATVLFMFSYNSLLFSNCPAVPRPSFKRSWSSSIRPVTAFRRLYMAASFRCFLVVQSPQVKFVDIVS